MLFLAPPFQFIKGVAIFPDHESENIIHYAPANPHLSMITDPVTGEQTPEFLLLKYRGDAGSGGFLNFSVDLSIDDATLEEVRNEVMIQRNLRGLPIMSPISFEDGTVKLMLLNAQTPDPNAPPADDDEPKRFVLDVSHPAKPSLYGDNKAIFSVELDADGVQLVEAALDGPIMNIGVMYQLDFHALRPAYSVKVSADWERVQTHFDETFSGNVFFAEWEISEVVDELIEDGAITINVDTFLPEGEDSGAWVGNRDQAIAEFKDMVTQNFFEPSTEVLNPAADGWDDEMKVAGQVGLLLATGGWAAVASFSYRKVDITQINKKSLNLQMNERTTVRKTIYPQSHLRGLFRPGDEQADGTLNKSRFVKMVTLNDDWFKKRTVTAHGNLQFDSDAISAVNITLDYGDELKSLRLTKADTEETASWVSSLVGNDMKMPVEYNYSVEFAGVDTAERPGRVDSGSFVTSGAHLDISPENDRLYFIDDIKIESASFPWDRFPSAEVHLRYKDAVNGIDLNDSLLVTQANARHVWRRFRMDEDLDAFEIRRVFHGADNTNRELPWEPINQELVLLTDPMPQKRTVTIVPNVMWELVSFILVEVSYSDMANGIFKSEPLTFDPSDQGRLPKTFAVNLADPDKRFVRYSARIIMKDGSQISIPTSETQGVFVPISLDTIGHRVVEVHGPKGDFAAASISRVEARLSFADPDHGLSATDILTFDAPGQIKFFEYDYARTDMRAVLLTQTEVFDNGMRSERNLGSTVENPLRLRLP